MLNTSSQLADGDREREKIAHSLLDRGNFWVYLGFAETIITGYIVIVMWYGYCSLSV